MKISVVTIAWNDLAGVQSTIESVRRQDWPDVEHIVVDGGSTDGTSEWLGEQGTDLVWVSEKDGGRYDAMNKGAAMASGDIVWFMHSSDQFHGTRAMSIVAETFARDDVKWGFGMSRIADDTHVIGIGGKIPFEHARFLLGGHVIPHQAAVFSSEFFKSLGGYDTDFGLTSDQLFMMKASMSEAPYVWTEVLCDFDASGAGSTRGVSAHYRDMIRARKTLGIRVTRSRHVDSAVSIYLAAATKAERVQRKLLRKAVPSTSIVNG